MLRRLKERYWEWARKEAIVNKAVADMRFSDLAESYALAGTYYEEKLGREAVQGDYVKPLPTKYLQLGATTEQEWLGNDPLGTYTAWMPQNSIYMELAQSNKYSGISIELSRIESRVVFND